MGGRKGGQRSDVWLEIVSVSVAAITAGLALADRAFALLGRSWFAPAASWALFGVALLALVWVILAKKGSALDVRREVWRYSYKQRSAAKASVALLLVTAVAGAILLKREPWTRDVSRICVAAFEATGSSDDTVTAFVVDALRELEAYYPGRILVAPVAADGLDRCVSRPSAVLGIGGSYVVSPSAVWINPEIHFPEQSPRILADVGAAAPRLVPRVHFDGFDFHLQFSREIREFSVLAIALALFEDGRQTAAQSILDRLLLDESLPPVIEGRARLFRLTLRTLAAPGAEAETLLPEVSRLVGLGEESGMPAANLYLLRGQLNLAAGRPLDAIEDYESALLAAETDEVLFQAHFSLGYLSTGVGRFHEGLRHNRQAIALRPRNIETRQNLAYSLMVQRRFPEASDEYLRLAQTSMGVAGGVKSHFLGLAVVASARAGEHLSQTSGDWPIGLRHRALSLALLDRCREALPLLSRLPTLGAEERVELSECELVLHQSSSVPGSLSGALRYLRNERSGYERRSRVHLDEGRRDLGNYDAERAAYVGYLEARAHIAISQTLSLQGASDLANQHLESARALGYVGGGDSPAPIPRVYVPEV